MLEAAAIVAKIQEIGAKATMAGSETTRSKAKAALSQAAIGKSQEMGRRFRLARQRRGWDLAECAERANVSVTTLKLVEAGDVSVGWVYYLSLLQLFGMITEVDGICNLRRDLLAPDLSSQHVSNPVQFDRDL